MEDVGSSLSYAIAISDHVDDTITLLVLATVDTQAVIRFCCRNHYGGLDSSGARTSRVGLSSNEGTYTHVDLDNHRA